MPDIAVIDVSFISLKLILPPLKAILKDQGKVVALIKPQFEAGKDKVGKKGLVRDGKIHEEVIEMIFQAATEMGYDVLDLTYSPITGGTGNIEFLTLLQNHQEDHQGEIVDSVNSQEVVQAAHQQFH